MAEGVMGVEWPRIEEDTTLRCPPDVQTATGHYDPSGTGADTEDDGDWICAGCGTPKKDHKHEAHEEACWLCGGDEPDTTIKTERDTPGGASCPEKDVKVHFGCLMDMDP